MKAIPTSFKTARLSFRPLNTVDLKDIYTLDGDERVAEFLYDPRITDATVGAGFIQGWQNLHASGGGLGMWRVALRKKDEFLGIGGLFPVLETDDVEFGGRMSPKSWIGNLAAEGSRELIWRAFEHVKLKRLLSFTAFNNRPAIAALDRLGFERRGEAEHYKRKLSLHVIDRERWIQLIRPRFDALRSAGVAAVTPRMRVPETQESRVSAA